MSACTYPFPLAARSSHHSNYHRFLLGAQASDLTPFPKPRCLGEMAEALPQLANDLTLAKWQKLYHGSFPWKDGFAAAHYSPNYLLPYRPVPADFGRPARSVAAYDFVQVADPAVSALALVAGDERVLRRFVGLNRQFCRSVEAGAAADRPGPGGGAATGRLLAGEFVEPNNRWLMPFLHAHARVLNFTSFAAEPKKLFCLDASALARTGRNARRSAQEDQAQALADLGYRVSLPSDRRDGLRVEGLSDRLLASIDAPRVAVLRLLERMLAESRAIPAMRDAQLPAKAAIGSLADRLEAQLAQACSLYRPAKIALPSEGPWTQAVRRNLHEICPADLAELDRASAGARKASRESALLTEGGTDGPGIDWSARRVFPVPPLDASHRHAPDLEALDAPQQQANDPDLPSPSLPAATARRMPPSLALLQAYEEVLQDVRADLGRGGPRDGQTPWRRTLREFDGEMPEAAWEELRQGSVFLDERLQEDRIDRRRDPTAVEGAGDRQLRPLASLDRLLADPGVRGALDGRERGPRQIGGRGR